MWTFPDGQAYDWWRQDKTSAAYLDLTMFSSDDTALSVSVVDRSGRTLGRGIVRTGDDYVELPRAVLLKARAGAQVRLMRNGQVLDTVTIKEQRGWSLLAHVAVSASSRAKLLAEPCSTVTWSYSSKGEPGGSQGSALGDTQRALASLSKYTGLTFRQVKDTAQATLRVEWDKSLGVNDPAGFGGQAWDGDEGMRGRVQLNPKNAWARGDYGSSLPRVILMQHEIAHTLGLGHVLDLPESTMAPYMRSGVSSIQIDSGTIRGLKALYRPQSCRR